MTDSFDIYHDIQSPSANRPGVFDRCHVLREVGVSAEIAAVRRAAGYVAVPHGAPGPDNTRDGRIEPNPYDPAIAAELVERARLERAVAADVGDLSGLTARQRKRRRQEARQRLSAG